MLRCLLQKTFMENGEEMIYHTISFRNTGNIKVYDLRSLANFCCLNKQGYHPIISKLARGDCSLLENVNQR